MNSIIDERKIKIDDSNNDELINKDFENHEVNSVKNQSHYLLIYIWRNALLIV
jgi:hypothetical protein